MIRELAERARAAERALRLQRVAAAAQKRPPIRVRASVQPTFVRFVFEMPNGVNVSSVLNDQKLTLQFNAVLNFDLADAKVAAPPNVASIGQKIDGETSAVEISLIGDVDVHSFREDKNYIIDVAFQQSGKSSALSPAAAALNAAAAAMPAPAAAPAEVAPMVTAPAAGDMPVPPKSGEAAPPPLEKPAKTADIAMPPETAPQPSPAPQATEPETPKPAPPFSETPAQPPPRIVTAQPPAEARSGDNAAAVRPARQRWAAPDVFLCHRDAGGVVSPGRYGLAGVRLPRRRSISRRSAAATAPSSPTPACCRWTRARRSGFGSAVRKCPRWRAAIRTASRRLPPLL